MSSGRSWSYQVVSAQELRRRALAAADARLERAHQSVAELQVEVAAAEATYGKLDVAVPAARPAGSSDPDVVVQQAAGVEAAVASVRAQVVAAVAQARGREIDRVLDDLLADMRPPSPLPDLTVSTPALAAAPATSAAAGPSAAAVAVRASQLDDARRVMGRLPGDADDDVMERCRQLVVQVGEASSTHRGEVLVTTLRHEVQQAKTRSNLVARNRDEVEALVRRLDGFDPGDLGDPAGPDAAGDTVGSLRGYLRGVALDAPLPADLAARVEQVRDAAARAQDRRFALDALREAFEEQGHTLGDDFVTVVATPEGALLPLAASRRHGARVRETAGRIFFEVVRFDRTTDGLDDVAAATSFCHSVDAMVERAGERGLDIADKVFVRAGEGRVERLDRESPFPQTTPTPAPPRARPQRRERQAPR